MELSNSSKLRWWGTRALEVLPAFVVALLVLPFIIASGKFAGWHPATIDLDVYRMAARAFLEGQDFYAISTPLWKLKFIYPPFAIIVLTPLAFGPMVLWQVLWTFGLVLAQVDILRRCGVQPGWRLALLSVATVVAVEPVRTTLGYGQINTFLVWLVVADLLPGRRRLLPRGVLIGLAAAIKLTPLLFVVLLVAIGLWKAAGWAFATFAGTTLVSGLIVGPHAWRFFASAAKGDTNPAPPWYPGNQSMQGVVTRLLHNTHPPATTIGLVLGVLAALAAVWAARALWQRSPALAVGCVGLGTCLASPMSWTHHYVWILPLLAVVATGQVPGRRLNAWAGFVTVWFATCLSLAVLPYGGGIEARYTWWQQIIANAGPVTVAVGVVVLAVRSLLPRHDVALKEST